MKTCLRITLGALIVGGACCASVSTSAPTAEEVPAPFAQSALRPATDRLLQEFLAPKHFWLQGEAGAKLVALGDKSVVPALLPLLESQDRSASNGRT